jgi:hypothetical protein
MSGNPASAIVGTSGSCGSRSAVVTASARTLPGPICPIAEDAVANMYATSPDTTASTAGGAPLYGTWVTGTPVCALNISPDSWPGLPTPPDE